MTTSKRHRLRSGAFVLTAAALLGIMLVVFAGLRIWKDTTRYYVVFAESVYGLETGAEVFVNGVRSGTVGAIRIDRADIRRVRVAIDLDANVPVRTDTHAVLIFSGITGLKVIDLRGGTADAPQLPAGGVIPVGQTTFDKLEARALAMADEATELMKRTRLIVERAQLIVTALVEVTDRAHLGETVVQAREAAANLARASAAMAALVEENRAGLKSSIASIDHAAQSASELLDVQLAEVIGSVDNLVGQLQASVRSESAQLRATLADLRQASRSFKEMAREVRQRPSRLLFSRPPPERELP
jgi:phospholipid/cholesterol/gamma-HCH transport system substrate-binding protein